MASGSKRRIVRKTLKRLIEETTVSSSSESVVSEENAINRLLEEGTIDSSETVDDFDQNSDQSSSDNEFFEPVIFDAHHIEATDNEQDLSLTDRLKLWAINNDITHHGIRSLLKVLKPFHPELPKDPRTLLGIKGTAISQEMSGGSFCYFGLSHKIQDFINTFWRTGIVPLKVNIDGLPLFKSDSTQLWPILVQIDNRKPFVVGMFVGKGKPDVALYLADFIKELKLLLSEGITMNARTYGIRLDAVICDAPAKGFVKQTKLFNGYSGEPQLDVSSQFHKNRTVFAYLLYIKLH